MAKQREVMVEMVVTVVMINKFDKYLSKTLSEHAPRSDCLLLYYLIPAVSVRCPMYNVAADKVCPEVSLTLSLSIPTDHHRWPTN